MDFGYRLRDSLPVILNNDTISSAVSHSGTDHTRACGQTGNRLRPTLYWPLIRRRFSGATEVCEEFYNTL